MYQLFNYWRPRGSRIVVAVFNKLDSTPYRFVLVDDTMYLPVMEGDRPQIHISNGFTFPIGIPTYMNGINSYENGPADPAFSDDETMLETPGGGTLVIRGFHNPDQKQTLPIVITNQGNRAEVADLHSTSESGIWRLYEKWTIGPPPDREWLDRWTVGDSIPYEPFYIDPNQPTENYVAPQPLATSPSRATESGSNKDIPSELKTPDITFGTPITEMTDLSGNQYTTVASKALRLQLGFRNELAEALGIRKNQLLWERPSPNWRKPWWHHVEMVETLS